MIETEAEQKWTDGHLLDGEQSCLQVCSSCSYVSPQAEEMPAFMNCFAW